MYLAIVNNTQDEREKKHYKKYLINEDAGDEEKIKLRPTENNDTALRYLLDKGDKDYEGYSHLVGNYRFFKDSINKDNINKIVNGLENLFFVEILHGLRKLINHVLLIFYVIILLLKNTKSQV